MSELIVPGQMISDRPTRQPSTYVEDGKTYSAVVAIKNVEGKIVPLQGPYSPVEGDFVVGVVTNVKFAGYEVALHTPYRAFLSSRELRDTFELGDIISAEIISVDEVKSMMLDNPRCLRGGMLAEFSPVKIPRLIGKKNSMLELIRGKTGCELAIGKNGYVWIGPGKTALAFSTIMKVEREAHISGLTNRIEEYLSKNGK